MPNTNPSLKAQTVADDASPVAAKLPAPGAPWHVEVGDLLAQSALLCAKNGVDMETFMKGAWSAYVEARPGLRDEIEEMQLKSQLDTLRKDGKIGLA